MFKLINKILSFFKTKKSKLDVKNIDVKKLKFGGISSKVSEVELSKMWSLHMQEVILNLIKSNNKITNNKIRNILNQNYNIILSAPSLRNEITKLRSLGQPILASNKGYWLSKDRKEIDTYINSRLIEIRKEQEVLLCLK